MNKMLYKNKKNQKTIYSFKIQLLKQINKFHKQTKILFHIFNNNNKILLKHLKTNV